MVTLRIQELAEAKGLTLEELSEISGISVEKIQKYGAESIDIQEDSAAELRIIAQKLNVTVVELVKPVAKRGSFQLKIQEMAESQGISLEQLSKNTKIHPALIVFYSTQSICKNKLSEPKFDFYLSEISKELGCSPDELKVAVELPSTSLRIEEFAKERSLTLKDLSQLSEMPDEFIELMANQPVDITRLIDPSNKFLDLEMMISVRELVCSICPKCC